MPTMIKIRKSFVLKIMPIITNLVELLAGKGRIPTIGQVEVGFWPFLFYVDEAVIMSIT